MPSVKRCASAKGRPGSRKSELETARMNRRALFLDRDGILNEVVMRGSVVGSPRLASELVLVADALKLIEEAHLQGLLVLGCSNQPDLERGLMSTADFEEIQGLLRRAFPLDDMAVCSGGDNADPRRKPNPGMLLELAEKHRLDLSQCLFLGDSSKDVEAGQRAGVITLFLETAYNRSHACHPDHRFATLKEVTDWLISRRSAPPEQSRTS